MRKFPMLFLKVAKFVLAAGFVLAVILSGHQALAAACGVFNYSTNQGACAEGVRSGPTQWDSQNSRWTWTCVGGFAPQTVVCYEDSCGNGNVDPGEVCDGAALNGQTCQSQGFSGGTLACQGTCRDFDTSGCQAAAVCGNSRKESAEQCDGADLGGQTCQSQGKNSGLLRCTTDCKFDTQFCSYCGNNRVDVGEQCDGQAGIMTCTQYNNTLYSGGVLKCFGENDGSACRYDVSACQARGPICGNGLVDQGEECDGENLNNKSCESEGYTSGTLTCSTQCRFNRNADNTYAGCLRNYQQPNSRLCTTPKYSPWEAGSFSVPCLTCGDAANQFFDEQPESGLCSIFGAPAKNPLVSELRKTMSNGFYQVYGWTWKCGQTTCNAYAKADCRADTIFIGSDDYCKPETYGHQELFGTGTFQSSLFPDYKDFVFKLNGLGTYSSNDWMRKCNVGYPGDLTKENRSISYLCMTGWGAASDVYNHAWTCTNAIPGTNLKDVVNCSAGWGGNGVCGAKNNKIYSRATEADYFFNDLPKATDLCGLDSPIIGEKKYTLTGYKDCPGGVRMPLYSFHWGCQWKKALRNFSGIMVDRYGNKAACQSYLQDDCVNYKPRCGNDVLKDFPTATESMPGKSLCLMGDPTTVAYDDATFTWSWRCAIKGKVDAQCSVKAKAACGAANGRGYENKTALLADGACLTGNTVEWVSEGEDWRWYCKSSNLKVAKVLCRASKCGDADTHTYSESTFSGLNNTAGFLCAAGGTAIKRNPFLSSGKPAEWGWSCSYRDNTVLVEGCWSTKLACGLADFRNSQITYTDEEFNIGKKYTDNFLCDDGWQLSSSLSSTGAGWTWVCVEEKNRFNNNRERVVCSAKQFTCGTFKDKNLAAGTLLGAYNAAKEIWDSGGGWRDNDQLCPPGVSYSTRPTVGLDGRWSWQCVNPNNSADNCAANAVTCGPVTAVEQSTVLNSCAQSGPKFCQLNLNCDDRYLAGPLDPVTGVTRWEIANEYYNTDNNLYSWRCLDAYGGFTDRCNATCVGNCR